MREQTSKHGISRPPRRDVARCAFAIVDVVVVAVVLSLGAAILTPGLARSREGQRTAVCLGNLGRFGQAISLYVADQAGSLPGPGYPSVPYNGGPFYLPNGPLGEVWHRQMLPRYLAPYLDGTDGSGRPADLAAFCPTADGMAVASSEGQPWYYRARLYYVCNTGSFPTTSQVPGTQPYFVTNPPNYFGYLHLGQSLDSFVGIERELRIPKRLDQIANGSREWAIADIWYWEAAPPRGATRLVGTWPYRLSGETPSNSIANEGQLKIPTYPFHLTGKWFSPTDSDRNLSSPRLTAGRTNAVFFDAHAESVRNWPGSVNPCFDLNGDKICD